MVIDVLRCSVVVAVVVSGCYSHLPPTQPPSCSYGGKAAVSAVSLAGGGLLALASAGMAFSEEDPQSDAPGLEQGMGKVGLTMGLLAVGGGVLGLMSASACKDAHKRHEELMSKPHAWPVQPQYQAPPPGAWVPGPRLPERN